MAKRQYFFTPRRNKRIRRNRASRARQLRIGHPISRKITKAQDTTDYGDQYSAPAGNLSALQTFNRRTLYRKHMDIIQKESQDHSYYRRETDIVNFKGWRIKMNFENNNGTQPLCINVALIAFPTWDEGQNPVVTDEFFKGYKTNDRTNDFNNVTLDSLEMNHLPLNTGKFRVIKRWRKCLSQDSTMVDAKSRYWFLDKYVSFKRQMIYDADDTEGGSITNGPSNMHVELVWWADKMLSDPNVADVTDHQFALMGHIISFWRDYRCY